MQVNQPIGRTPEAFEMTTITSATVVRLNEAYRKYYKAVYITIEDNPIRYRIDGGDASDALGHSLVATQSLYFEDPQSLRELRMIATGGDAVAQITYYK